MTLGIFEALAADDSDDRATQRKAIAIANKRVTAKFGAFLDAAKSPSERTARLDLVRGDVKEVIASACNELGGDPKSIETSILSRLALHVEAISEQDLNPHPAGESINLEPNWEGMRAWVKEVARTDPDTARKINESMGREAVPPEELGGPHDGLHTPLPEHDEDIYNEMLPPPVASVHEAVRRPKMCPYHKEVTDISLAAGDPTAGFNAMSQHAWGANHCQGEFEGGCNFKPQMVTQKFWDDKAEKAQERREQREQELAIQQEVQETEVPESPEGLDSTEPAADPLDGPSINDELAEAPSAVGSPEPAAETPLESFAAATKESYGTTPGTTNPQVLAPLAGPSPVPSILPPTPGTTPAPLAGSAPLINNGGGAPGPRTVAPLAGPTPSAPNHLPAEQAGPSEPHHLGPTPNELVQRNQHAINEQVLNHPNFDPGAYNLHNYQGEEVKRPATVPMGNQPAHPTPIHRGSVKQALTAKDFVLIAQAIATSPIEDKSAVAQHFAGYLANTNPNFDVERFIAAAGGQPTTGRDNYRGPDPQDLQIASVRVAEALKTVDVDAGSAKDPSPEMNKDKIPADGLGDPEGIEMEGSPNPTDRIDPLVPLAVQNDEADFLDGSRAVTETQKVDQASSFDGNKADSGSWAGNNGASPVTSFVHPNQVQAAIRDFES